MPRTLIVADRTHDEAPYDPVVRVLRTLLDGFLNFVNSLCHIALFEQSEGPVPMADVALRDVNLGRPTELDGLLPELMHIV